MCVAAYAGAAIAGSDPWKTGWTSFKFAKMLYIGPFLFAYDPGFLLGGPNHMLAWWDVLESMATIVLATIAFGSLTMGYLLCATTIFEWCIFAVATAVLFFPKLLSHYMPFGPLVSSLIGVLLWALVYLLQKVRIKRNPTLTLPVHERKKLKEAAL